MSKLGPHCLKPTADAKAMLDAGARIIKLVDDFGVAEYALSKGAVVIGRAYCNFTAESQRGEEPKAAAQRFIDSQIERYRLNPLIKLWEGHNEPVWGSLADMEWYAEFEIERIKQMAKLGLRCVIGNFSTGNPDLSLWPAFLPAVASAKANNGILGLHEYSSPWMWWMTGSYQVAEGGPDSDEGWTTLRYRKVIRQYLKPAGLEGIPIAITEFGLDRVSQVRPGMSTGHWRTNAAWWNAANSDDGPIPYNPDHELYYAEQLIWYDAQIQKDPSVIGATIFTVGSNNSAWDGHNIEGRVAIRLIEYIRASSSEPSPTPTPTPEPEPTPPLPGDSSMAINFSELDYSKTYHVQNNIDLPVGMKYKFAPPTIKVSWKDIKPGSPTFGQIKTMDQEFAEPECKELVQALMPDIPYPLGKSIAIKDFVGFKPRWSLIYFSFKAVVGTKYRLAWKVRPELISGYNPDNSKIYAPDPASGWLRLRVRHGEVEMEIDGLNPDEVPVDQAWKNGRDFPFGSITEFVAVIDAIQDVMTVGLETLGPHGLPDNDFISWMPELTVISTPTEPNTGDNTPPEGTLREAAQRVLIGLNGINSLEQAAHDIINIIG